MEGVGGKGRKRNDNFEVAVFKNIIQGGPCFICVIYNKRIVGKFDKRKDEYYTIIFSHLMGKCYIYTTCDKN